MSIKAYAPNIPILLVHDDKQELTEKEMQFFDIVKIADKEDYGREYQRMKLCVDKYTEFENTLYIDVDTMWFPKKSVAELFANIEGRDFWIGMNGFYAPKSKMKTSVNYTYWGDPAAIVNHFKLENNLPQTISGLFYFTKSERITKMFELAREVYDDKKAPVIKWANGKPDEYCFNVALSKVGYSQNESHLVYFDKINGTINNSSIYKGFWAMAAGGNELNHKMAKMYNDLVDIYADAYEMPKHYHRDKKTFIPERRGRV